MPQQATCRTNPFKSWHLHLPPKYNQVTTAGGFDEQDPISCLTALLGDFSENWQVGKFPVPWGHHEGMPAQLHNEDSHNRLLPDKGYPKSQCQSFVHLGPIAFRIKRCLGFLPAVIPTSSNFTFRPLDKGALLCTGNLDPKEKQRRGKVCMSERRMGWKRWERRERRVRLAGS